MIIADLFNKLPLGEFIEVAKLKLNRTLVKLDNKWVYLLIDASDITSSWKMGKEGHSNLWKALYVDPENTKTANKRGNDLTILDTEPEWPDPGYYLCNNILVHIQYNHGKMYKAGLPISLLSIQVNEQDIVDPVLMAYYLTLLEGAAYPSVTEAVELLLTTDLVRVPLSKDLLVGAWPYSEAPILIYQNFAVGFVDSDNQLVPADDSPANIEIIKHVEQLHENV